MLSPRTALLALGLILIAPAAQAQPLPPSPPAPPPAALEAPPAGYAPPPADYAPPPAGYAPPPVGYIYVPEGYPAPAPLGPDTLPYKDGYPIPDGYRPEMRYRMGLIIGGAATFGAMYLFTAAGAASSRDSRSLFVPIAGPFIQLGQLGPSEFAPILGAFLIIDGLAQTVGAAMLTAGLAQKKQVLVRHDVATPTVRLTPLTMGHGGRGVGLGLVGEM